MTRTRGFTLLEMMLACTLLAVLATAVFPTTQKIVKRQKEVELKRVLLELRTAIDRYKKATEDGLIEPGELEQLGYPADLQTMIDGVKLQKTEDRKMKFLRRIPIDPMTGTAEWGLRSVQDDPDTTTWGRENVFDVFSLSDGTALDGTAYSEW